MSQLNELRTPGSEASVELASRLLDLTKPRPNKFQTF